MTPNTVYDHFDPTSIVAGDLQLVARKVTLASGQNSSGSPLGPGMLLGAQSVQGAFTAAASAKGGNTGNGAATMGSPATLANAKVGVYSIQYTSATAFTVYDPSGDEIGVGVNGTAFAEEIKFTAAAGGTAFVAGDVLLVTVKAAAANPLSAASVAGGSNVGNGTLTLASPATLNYAQPGVYSLVMTSATTFNVLDPEGNIVGTGSTGVAFATQIAFTLAAGGTAFAQGDSFAITVSATVLYLGSVATAVDGSQNPICVLADYADTSGGAVTVDAYFQGEFAYEEMTIDASWPTLGAINANLVANNRPIYLRSVGTAA